MYRNNFLTRVGAALVLAAIISTGVVVAGDPNEKEASAEMKWGFKAARRGYWQEALLRFEHANELTPNRARILNNIAVAQEANGLFELALLTYQELLEKLRRDHAAGNPDQSYNLVECRYYIASSLFGLGRYAECDSVCREILSLPLEEEIQKRQNEKLRRTGELSDRCLELLGRKE